MSIWADHAIKEMQEKIAWLEKENAEIKREIAQLKAPGPTRLGLPNKGKPS